MIFPSINAIADEMDRLADWMEHFKTLNPANAVVLDAKADVYRSVGKMLRDARIGKPPGALVMTKGRVQCLTTGETFANAAEACRAHDLSPAALSKHLSGSDSYNSVRGNRYKRLT